jgi:two-component system, LytTR family, response regulator LytT
MDTQDGRLNVVVVEDDHVQIQVIKSYIARVPEIGQVHYFDEPHAALAHLQEHATHLLLLDIGLPDLNGFDLLGRLKSPPLVVIITADPVHALEGYEQGAVDMLTKPFTLERFIKGIRRTTARLGTPLLDEPEGPDKDRTGTLVFRSGQRMLRIPAGSIIKAEALGNHVKLHLDGRTIIVNATMRAMEEMLIPHGFIRVHRAHIVARRAIVILDGDMLYTRLGEVPIGATYKKHVVQMLDQPTSSSVL